MKVNTHSLRGRDAYASVFGLRGLFQDRFNNFYEMFFQPADIVINILQKDQNRTLYKPEQYLN